MYRFCAAAESLRPTALLRLMRRLRIRRQGSFTRLYGLVLNPLTPNDNCSGRTAPLTSKVAFYIFIQQI